MAKRKVILVTAFENGAVTQFIEHFQKLSDPSFEIQAVIQASAPVLKSKRFLRQKLKKALKIGWLKNRKPLSLPPISRGSSAG